MSLVSKVSRDLQPVLGTAPLPADATTALMFVVSDLTDLLADAEEITLDANVIGGYRKLLTFLRSRYGNHSVFDRYLSKFADEGR